MQKQIRKLLLLLIEVLLSQTTALAYSCKFVVLSHLGRLSHLLSDNDDDDDDDDWAYVVHSAASWLILDELCLV